MTGSFDGSPTLRRAFVHALALLGALLTGAGAAGLLRVALELLTGSSLATDTAEGTALGLALLIVGLPLWALSWTAAQRAARRDPTEATSRLRRLQLTLVRLVALAIAVVYAFDVGAWLLAAGPYEPTAVARTLVWVVVWVYHERVAAEVAFGSTGTGRLDRLHVYLVGTVGLLLLGTGVATILMRSLQRLYDVLLRPEAILLDAGGDLRLPLVGAVLGTGVWWWHWHVLGARDRGSTGWHVYLFLVGMLGGIAAAIGGAATLVHRVLAWLLALTDGSLVEHFDVVPAALTGIVIGTAGWGHHRAVLRGTRVEASDTWSAPQRAYEHLLVAVGVLTTGAGLATVLALGIELALPTTTLGGAAGPARRALAVGMSLLLVGVPLWALAWRRIRRQVGRDPAERDTGARRALILGVFGLGILVSVGALGTLLYTILDAVLAGRWRIGILADQRWSLALVLTAGAIATHYGLVLREDRRAAPAPPTPPTPSVPPVGPRRVMVVGDAPDGLARDLAERLEVEVQPWRRSDGPRPTTGTGDVPASEETPLAEAIDVAAIARDVRDRETVEAIVLVEPDGAWRVLGGNPV